MLLSIIITLYNRKQLIGRCVESIQNLSSNEDVEVIIIDDGSTDEPLNVLSDYLDNKKIQYHYKENGGAADAKNYGAALATGEFIIFLDSDDYLINGEHLLSYIRNTHLCGYDFYYSSSVFIKKDDLIMEDKIIDGVLSAQSIYQYILAFPLHYPGKPTYVFNRNTFVRSGGFCKKFRWGDAMLFWRVFLKNASCCEINFPSYVYDQSGNDSISRSHNANYYSNVYSTLSKTFYHIEHDLIENKMHLNWGGVLFLLALRCHDYRSVLRFFLMLIKEPVLSLKSFLVIANNRRAK